MESFGLSNQFPQACRSLAFRFSAQVLSEELKHSLPGLLCVSRVVDLSSRVVEEGVTGTRVDVKLSLLACTLQLLLEFPHRFRRDRTILFSEESEHWRLQIANLWMNVR